ncbi:unnamed protein product [Urochloa humidicola]
MAPPPLPELIEDAIAEILTRLPPDDPACLQRAAFVCKTWRRVLSDPAFLRRRRAFHRTPPPLPPDSAAPARLLLQRQPR